MKSEWWIKIKSYVVTLAEIPQTCQFIYADIMIDGTKVKQGVTHTQNTVAASCSRMAKKSGEVSVEELVGEVSACLRIDRVRGV